MSGWLPVSTRPKESGRYLVLAPSDDPKQPYRDVGYYKADVNQWFATGAFWEHKITHWAEFPPNPRVENGRSVT